MTSAPSEPGVPPRLAAALADRYRLERELGQGGMATVYLAEDLKHKRRVAIKVLKPELAAVLGAERFVQEITTTAALQHPNILPLFDSGEADSFLYYVMPFIDGETLRAKLDRETQLGVTEAVALTCDVADALEYAHQHGVIHRDIKPENILLANGRPMVADFGIALAVSAAAGGRMTETGLSLGTPHYMSPEQATAEKEITARSDIYSLGSVLYEMLTGNPPHTGASAQQIIMKIVTEDAAPVTKLRKTVPEGVADAVAQSLEKLPADRFASAAAFAAALRGQSAARVTMATARRRTVQGPWRRMAIGASVVAIVAVLAAAAALLRSSTGPASNERIEFAFKFDVPPLERPFLEISPDGRKVLQIGRDADGISRILVRDLGSTVTTTVAGTESARDPRVSPDGKWIVFQAENMLRKVPIGGGPAVTLADGAVATSAWSEDGATIYYPRSGDGLWSVPAAGGKPTRITSLDTAGTEFAHWEPMPLPGGKVVLINVYRSPVSKSTIEAVELATGKRTVLVEGGLAPQYLRSGYLLYMRDKALLAAPFDAGRVQLTAPAVPVLEDVAWAPTDNVAGYAVSATGTLVYLRASAWFAPRHVVVTDRTGTEQPIGIDDAQWAEPRFSPDGRWLSLTRTDLTWQIWLYDRSRRVLSQLTRSAGVSFSSAWTPDSRAIAHAVESPAYDLQRTPIDGTAPTMIVANSYDKKTESISPDGRTVLYHQTDVGDQLYTVPIEGGTPTRVNESSTMTQRNADFSPDGRWLAFAEFPPAQLPQVYVRSLAAGGGRRQVSADGGDQPLWSKNGREIVFRRGDAVLAASFDPATGEVGRPEELFRKPDAGRLSSNRTLGYDVSADGSRFVLITPVGRPDALPTVVVTNWLEELKKKVPR